MMIIVMRLDANQLPPAVRGRVGIRLPVRYDDKWRLTNFTSLLLPRF